MVHRSLVSSRLLSILTLSLILASLLPQSVRPVSAQTPASNITRFQGNGIFVDSPKVYDDFSLRIMLNAARARLAALQVIDQNALTSRIGAVTGATLTQSSLAAQVLGPPVPQSVVTESGATGSTSTVTTGTETAVTGQAPAGPSSSTTNVSGSTTTVNQGQPVQNIVTTNPQATASIPGLPSSSAFGLPTNFSVSSLDALSEAMQLTYEIANIQLLLEGSLSDRYVRDERIIKPRTTLGFPITISPNSDYKDAVAVVDVELEPPPGRFSNEPPAVTALLPREKTYNVAAITDKSTSIGGGFVSQVINGGLTFFRGRKTFYLVKDQDTLAMQRTSSDASKASFAWQFQPVLGQRFVRPGMRQTFVQIANAIPEGVNAGCFGKVKVTTYWQKYDRKHGILKDIIPESIRIGTLQPIPRYDITPVAGPLGMEDLGSGLVLTKINGNFGFLHGTYIRIGPTIYRDGSLGFSQEDRQIRFIAPAADIARYKAYIVSRDGSEIEILDPRDPAHLTPINTSCDGRTKPQEAARVVTPPGLTTKITAFDNNNSVVTATLTNPPAEPSMDKYLIVIGGRVFGLSDAPISRSRTENGFILRAVVPTNLLLSATAIEVKPLFWKKNYGASQPVAELHVESSPDKVVFLTPTATGAKFLLYGNRLAHASIIIPANVQLQPFSGFAGVDTLRTFELNADQLKTVKQIVLQKGAHERPTFLSVPSPAPDKAPTLTANERVIVGATEIVLTGDNLGTLRHVRFKGKEIRFIVSEDKKSVTLLDLGATGLTISPVKRELEFEFEDKKKSNLTLDIINSKVETVFRERN